MNFDQREGAVDTDVEESDSCQRLRFMNPHWRAPALPFACTARGAIFGDQDSSEVEQQI